MIQWSIAPTLPDQPMSQELGYDPMIHRSNDARPTSESGYDPMIHCSNAARPTYVPRIRLWSNDPLLHRCQTNLWIRLWSNDPSLHRSSCPKKSTMIQWSSSLSRTFLELAFLFDKSKMTDDSKDLTVGGMGRASMVKPVHHLVFPILGRGRRYVGWVLQIKIVFFQCL